MTAVNTIWILGTVERALKTATAQGLFVQSARLNPIDFKSLADSITKRVASALPVPTSIVLISDDGISIGYTRLECVKLPSGLEFGSRLTSWRRPWVSITRCESPWRR